MVETMTSAPPPRLRPLDPDLPVLAAQAAIELDLLGLGRKSELESLKSLRELLRNSFVVDPVESTRSFIDAGTETLVYRSFTEATQQALKSRQQLVDEAWTLMDEMFEAEAGDNKQVLERLRDFCVALSRSAAAYSESVQGGRPAPPYRRMEW